MKVHVQVQGRCATHRRRPPCLRGCCILKSTVCRDCLVGVEHEVGEGGTRRCTRATRSACVRHGGHLGTFKFTPGCEHSHLNCTMSSPLADVWEAAAASPFQPTIGKETQFTLGFALLFACTFLSVQATRSHANTAAALLLTGFFGLSTSTPPPQRTAPRSCSCSHLPSRRPFASQRTPRRRPSFDSIWVRTSKTRRNGCANSSRFGAVYMICAVGVYV